MFATQDEILEEIKERLLVFAESTRALVDKLDGHPDEYVVRRLNELMRHGHEVYTDLFEELD